MDDILNWDEDIISIEDIISFEETMHKSEIKQSYTDLIIENIKLNSKIDDAIKMVDYLISNADLVEYQGEKIKSILKGEDND